MQNEGDSRRIAGGTAALVSALREELPGQNIPCDAKVTSITLSDGRGHADYAQLYDALLRDLSLS